MSSKTSKAQPKSPVVRRSKRLQEQLRNAIAVQSQLGAGLPQDALQEQLPNAVAFPPSVGAGLPQDPEVLGERASYQVGIMADLPMGSTANPTYSRERNQSSSIRSQILNTPLLLRTSLIPCR